MCYPSSEPCSLLLNALAGAGGGPAARRWGGCPEPSTSQDGGDETKRAQHFTRVVDAQHFPNFKGLRRQEAQAYLNNPHLVSGETKK